MLLHRHPVHRCYWNHSRTFPCSFVGRTPVCSYCGEKRMRHSGKTVMFSDVGSQEMIASTCRSAAGWHTFCKEIAIVFAAVQHSKQVPNFCPLMSFYSVMANSSVFFPRSYWVTQEEESWATRNSKGTLHSKKLPFRYLSHSHLEFVVW